MPAHPLIVHDGVALLLTEFLPLTQAVQCFARLATELVWRTEDIVCVGRRLQVPRRVCWYGDAGAIYRYSGVVHVPLPWTPTLSILRPQIAAAAGDTFNSVLGNFYRDGCDSMGWHADDEPELGREPVIASLSLGATRRVRFRHKSSGATVTAELPSGSLLIMRGALQQCWKHCIPKTAKPVGPRINLTFRFVVPLSAGQG